MQLSQEEQDRVTLARAIFTGTDDTKFHPPYFCIEEIERLLPERDGLTQYQLLDIQGKSDIPTMYKKVLELRDTLGKEYAKVLFNVLTQQDFAVENEHTLTHPDNATKLNDFRFSTGILVPDDQINAIKEISTFTNLPYDELLQQDNAEMTLFMEKERGYREIARAAFDALPESRNPERTRAVLYECLTAIGADESIISPETSSQDMKTLIHERVKQGYLQLAFEEFEIISGGQRIRSKSEAINGTWAEQELSAHPAGRFAAMLQNTFQQVTENDPQQAVQRLNGYLQQGEATYADLATYLTDKMQQSERPLPRLTETLQGKEGLDAEIAMTHLISRLLEKQKATSQTR